MSYAEKACLRRSKYGMVNDMNCVRISLLFVFMAVTAGATPQQDAAFLRVWNAHAAEGADHMKVVAVCQSVMDKASTLGEWLPAVKTIAAWHLLAAGKESDAVRVFESAVTKETSTKPVARFADIMARRWLSRIDAQSVSKALRKYYAAHVAYPSSLAPVLNAKLPPPAKDRFGDAWVYRLETFSRIQGLESQKFALFSSTIGKESMPLKPTLRKGYAPGYAATLISVKALNNTQMAEFEATSPGNAAQKGLTNEGGRAVNGVRLIKVGSDKRFALMIDVGDFWIMARPK